MNRFSIIVMLIIISFINSGNIGVASRVINIMRGMGMKVNGIRVPPPLN